MSDQGIHERIASMAKSPLMWAATREDFGLQLLLFTEMLLWPDGDTPSDEMNGLREHLFGPNADTSAGILDASWGASAVEIAQTFIQERLTRRSLPVVTRVHYDVKDPPPGPYLNLLTMLGGACKPEIVGWCELSVDGEEQKALVVSQAWPFLPCGTDPKPFIKAKKYVALFPDGAYFRYIDVPPPSAVKETT